jgi:chloramphenicol 3-O-phosphotransferase
MSKGKIICLNGVSSSGKSTLARSLQEILEQPYYLMSEDTFVFILPDKFNAFKNDTEENDKYLEEALFNYYHTIKLYSDNRVEARRIGFRPSHTTAHTVAYTAVQIEVTKWTFA